MAICSSSREAFEEALIDLGFSVVRQFGVFVTYERQRDLVKVHAAPDGMFAAFGEDDEILGEGTGVEDLRSVLIKATLTATGYGSPAILPGSAQKNEGLFVEATHAGSLR